MWLRGAGLQLVIGSSQWSLLHTAEDEKGPRCPGLEEKAQKLPLPERGTLRLAQAV